MPSADGGDAGLDPLLVGRPYNFSVPRNYDPGTPTPLLILLHGYGVNGVVEDALFSMSQLAEEKGFLYADPDGTQDTMGHRFWNATDACCNLYGAKVDDVAYLTAIIKDMKARYNVDAQRVFLVGHSNGGFMAYRMACDVADQIAGIVSLAGDTWLDPGRCKPTARVAVLQLHGDKDMVINYDGGQFYKTQGNYPSAHETVAQWAKHDGCTGMLAPTGMQLDIDGSVPGAETRVESYAGCPQTAVELWTMQGGGHFPKLSLASVEPLYQFLMDHPKRPQ